MAFDMVLLLLVVVVGVRHGVLAANDDVAPTSCCCCWPPTIMVVNFICKCCWLLGSQLSISQYVAIAIVIVGPRYGCTWREGHGHNKGSTVFTFFNFNSRNLNTQVISQPNSVNEQSQS